jgi:hypothetical protein
LLRFLLLLLLLLLGHCRLLTGETQQLTHACRSLACLLLLLLLLLPVAPWVDQGSAQCYVLLLFLLLLLQQSCKHVPVAVQQSCSSALHRPQCNHAGMRSASIIVTAFTQHSIPVVES